MAFFRVGRVSDYKNQPFQKEKRRIFVLRFLVISEKPDFSFVQFHDFSQLLQFLIEKNGKKWYNKNK